MKYIIVCVNDNKPNVGFPRPLQYMYGIHSIQYILESIPSDEIYIILHKDIKEYHFDTLAPHFCKKNIKTVYVDTNTFVESAYIGLKQFDIPQDEPICLIDNDMLYSFHSIQIPLGSWIGYSIQTKIQHTGKYSYVDIYEGKLRQISENITDQYMCGIYGFAKLSLFLNTTSNTDHSISSVYNRLLQANKPVELTEVIQPIFVDNTKSLHQHVHSLRVCFDIDNTLFQYNKQRQVTQSYKECEPIPKIIYLLKKLHQQGHTIILYTARGMKSASGNQGKTMKVVAKDTFELLEAHDIPFDEIYFGKPNADIYIDDKAFNPYIHLFESIGFDNLRKEYEQEKLMSDKN